MFITFIPKPDNDSDKELSKLSPESLPSLPTHISDTLFSKHFIDIALAIC